MATKKATKSAARKVATKATKKTAEKGIRRSTSKVPRLQIRMYRHGLGDCLLLRFAQDKGKSNGKGTFNVLIDCGLISVATNPKVKVETVVADLAQACDSRLDVVVMTHEHWDHASGFSTQQAQAAFDAIEIGEVWYAWTEDPANALGRKLRRERAAKVKAVAVAAQALTSIEGNALAARRGADLASMLGFFGLDLAAVKAGKGEIGKTRAAFEYPGRRSDTKVRYRHAKDPPVTFKGVPNLRVYCFGPHEDELMLKKSRPTKSGREVYELSAELSVTTHLDSAFARLSAAGSETGFNTDCPFDDACNRRQAASWSDDLQNLQAQTWNAPAEEWRRIELDWTQAAESLALNLDSHTNNTCLVLAFEFIDTGEVFLFPADAQLGNWLSWQELRWKVKTDEGLQYVTAPELLARTVFYKVGHHGSHNATLRELGLELMTSENLVAFVPVIKAEAMKNRWKEMPFNPLVERLQQRTRGRLLRSDDSKAPDAAQLTGLTASERKRFSKALGVGPKSADHKNGLYYEFTYD